MRISISLMNETNTFTIMSSLQTKKHLMKNSLQKKSVIRNLQTKNISLLSLKLKTSHKLTVCRTNKNMS